MKRQSVWNDDDILSATIRQIAIDNGTPNVMPTLNQMKGTPGLVYWIQNKEGGVRKLSEKLKLIMKPNVLPFSDKEECKHKVMKGATVFIHTKTSVYPAIVLDKSSDASGLIVLVLNKKLTRKHVRYGVEPTNKFQWCYAKDMPKDLIAVLT